MDGDDALAAFTRDFAATQASDAYSNATFVLSLTGLFATLNQVVAHLVAEHVVHGARACFAPHAAWAYAPSAAFERARACAGVGCYLQRELA